MYLINWAWRLKTFTCKNLLNPNIILKKPNLNKNPYFFQGHFLFAPHRCTPKSLGIDSPISVAPVFGKAQMSLYVRISVLYISYWEPVGKQSGATWWRQNNYHEIIKKRTKKNKTKHWKKPKLPRFSLLTGRGKIWDPRSCTKPSKDPPAQNYVLVNKALKMDIKSLLSDPHRLEVHLTQSRNWSNRTASFGGFRA